MIKREVRMVCEECGWNGRESEILKAPHPFLEVATIIGCPDCRETFLLRACDEPGCPLHVSAGFPTDEGYRHMCSDHFYRWQKKERKR